MGYVCPVCGDPQSDGHHLANHLAFTAMLGDDAHEAWLDDHAPGWADADPEDLAPRVTEHAEETEFPQVFEDTTDATADDGHDHDHGPDVASSRDGVAFDDAVDPAARSDDRDAADVIAEARELTRRRRENADSDTGRDEAGADESGGG